MSLDKRARRAVGLLATIGLIGTLAVVTSESARADDPDVPIAIDFSDLATIRDVNGNTVLVEDITEGEALTTTSGTSVAGHPFELNVFFGEQPQLDADEINDLIAAPPLPSLSENAPSETVDFESSDYPVDLESLEATFGIAVTDTTLTVAWPAPDATSEFELYLDEGLVGAGSTSVFSVTSLTPDTEYSARTRSLAIDLGEDLEDESDDSLVVVGESLVTIKTLSEGSSSARSGGGARSLLSEDEVRSTEFNYRRFIPYPTVSDSPVGPDHVTETACLTGASVAHDLGDPLDLTFVGDNRTYVQPSRDVDYRTMMSVRYDWNSLSWHGQKDVGTTKIKKKSTGEIVAMQSCARPTADVHLGWILAEQVVVRLI